MVFHYGSESAQVTRQLPTREECSRIWLRVISAFHHIKDFQIPVIFDLCEKALCIKWHSYGLFLKY